MKLEDLKPLEADEIEDDDDDIDDIEDKSEELDAALNLLQDCGRLLDFAVDEKRVPAALRKQMSEIAEEIQEFLKLVDDLDDEEVEEG